MVREDPRDVARDHYGLPHRPADPAVVERLVQQGMERLDPTPWMTDRPLPPGPVLDIQLLCTKPQRGEPAWSVHTRRVRDGLRAALRLWPPGDVHG